MARLWAPSGVVAGQLNELNPFGDSTGLQAKVDTGAAWVRGQYGEWTSANPPLGLAAVGGIAGGSERWDRLIVRNDFVNNVMQLDVLTGTAGASPNAARPALTQSSSVWEFLLADVGPLVNTTTTVTAGMVKDGRWKISANGILYYDVTLGASATSVLVPAAGTIPSFGRHLQLDYGARDISAGTSVDVLLMQFNSNSGSNYNTESVRSLGTTVTGSEALLVNNASLILTQGGVAANAFGGGLVRIHAYASAAIMKNWVATLQSSTTTAATVYATGGLWNQLTAITSLLFTPNVGSLAAGSFFTLSVIP
jgi:hypothetical protein